MGDVCGYISLFLYLFIYFSVDDNLCTLLYSKKLGFSCRGIHDFFFVWLPSVLTEPRQANLCLRAFRHDKF